MLIPPLFIDCVAAIGNMRPKLEGLPDALEWANLRCRFLLYATNSDEEDMSKRRYAVFLVTAKHVITAHIDSQTDTRIRLDSKDTAQPVRDFELPRTINEPGTWFFVLIPISILA